MACLTNTGRPLAARAAALKQAVEGRVGKERYYTTPVALLALTLAARRSGTPRRDPRPSEQNKEGGRGRKRPPLACTTTHPTARSSATGTITNALCARDGSASWCTLPATFGPSPHLQLPAAAAAHSRRRRIDADRRGRRREGLLTSRFGAGGGATAGGRSLGGRVRSGASVSAGAFPAGRTSLITIRLKVKSTSFSVKTNGAPSLRVYIVKMSQKRIGRTRHCAFCAIHEPLCIL